MMFYVRVDADNVCAQSEGLSLCAEAVVCQAENKIMHATYRSLKKQLFPPN